MTKKKRPQASPVKISGKSGVKLPWIVVDVITCALYFYKGIPFKASLYGLYVIIAVAGYIKWRKMLNIS